jgi:hypothetical protein
MSKKDIFGLQLCDVFLSRYYKDPALCVKCLLDGIPTDEKPSDDQTNSILEILGRLI